MTVGRGPIRSVVVADAVAVDHVVFMVRSSAAVSDR
jgi:hypothetical protein